MHPPATYIQKFIKLLCFQFSSVVQSCPTLCNPMNRSTPGLPVHHQLPSQSSPKLMYIESVMPSNHFILSSLSPAFNLSLPPGLFKWVSSLNQVAKVLGFQLQHQPFQWIFRTDFLQDGLIESPCSSRDSQKSSPKPQIRSINFSALSFLYAPTLTCIHDHWKNHSLD